MTVEIPPLLGFAAFSGTGKTTLLAQLLPIFKRQGWRIGVVKHAHHQFEIDRPGKDSYRLREAGAEVVMLSARGRRAVLFEHGDVNEPVLAEELRYLPYAELDLILVEGYKHEPIPKIELHRPSLGKPLLFPHDPQIIAIAVDAPLPRQPTIPLLDLNQPERIAEFIHRRLLMARHG